MIAVSVSTMNGEVDRIRESCNDFLSKPVQREELVRTLARFLPCRVHAAPAAPLAEATPAPPAAPQPEVAHRVLQLARRGGKDLLRRRRAGDLDPGALPRDRAGALSQGSRDRSRR